MGNELIIDSHSYDEEKNIDANLTKKQQEVKIKAASAKQPQQTNDNNNRLNDNKKEALIPDLNDDQLKTKSSAQQNMPGKTLEKQEQSSEKTEVDLTTEQKELKAKSSVQQHMQGNILKEQEQSIEKIEVDLTTKQKEAIAKEHEEKKDKSIDNSNQDYTVKCNVVKPSITTTDKEKDKEREVRNETSTKMESREIYQEESLQPLKIVEPNLDENVLKTDEEYPLEKTNFKGDELHTNNEKKYKPMEPKENRFAQNLT